MMNKESWEIPKPGSEDFKKIVRISIHIIALIGFLIVIFRFLVPFLFSMIDFTFHIIETYYANLDNVYIRFFGGLILLYGLYKIVLITFFGTIFDVAGTVFRGLLYELGYSIDDKEDKNE